MKNQIDTHGSREVETTKKDGGFNMKFNVDNKEYDSDKLSDNGKLILARLQNIKAKKDQLTIDFSELNIVEKNYIDLLKKELPKEEEKVDVK